MSDEIEMGEKLADDVAKGCLKVINEALKSRNLRCSRVVEKEFEVYIKKFCDEKDLEDFWNGF